MYFKLPKKKNKTEYSRKFRETHPDYHRNYMRNKRKLEAEKKIQEAYDALYGKD